MKEAENNSTLKTLIWAGLAYLAITKIPELKNCAVDLKNEAGKTTDFAAKQYEDFKKFLQSENDKENSNKVIERCPVDIKKTHQQRKMFY